MNRSLQPPAPGDLHFLAFARDSARTGARARALLRAHYAAASVCVGTYRATLSALTAVTPVLLNERDRDAFEALYNRLSTDDHESGLRAAVLENPSHRHHLCPYCEISATRQIDHFLPLSSYAVLAVEPINMVPSCVECNWLKSNKGSRPDGTRYPHPYLDPEPLGPWFEANVSWIGSIPVAKFALIRPQDVDQKLLDGFEDLFSELELARRYGEQAAQELTDANYRLRLAIQRPLLLGRARAKIKKLERSRGTNYWMLVLYRGVAKSLS